MNKSKISGDIVKEYIKKYPSLDSKRIARLIVSEIPELFKDVENARTSVRYYRGACGEYNRLKIDNKNLISKINVDTVKIENDYVPYEISSDKFPIIIGADFQIPFQENDIIEIFLERAIDLKAKTILLDGDILDSYQISRFLKDPRERSINEEINILIELLEIFNKYLPDCDIVYKYGNHDERFDNHLMNCAPELFKLPEMRLENLIRQKLNSNINLIIVDKKRIIKAGHLNVIHGHEYVYSISNPVNPARGLFNKTKKSALCAHFHQTSEHTEPTIDDKIITCWSIGCMCNLHPQWIPLNKWNHGFAEITNEDEFFNVRNRRIVNYRLF